MGTRPMDGLVVQSRARARATRQVHERRESRRPRFAGEPRYVSAPDTTRGCTNAQLTQRPGAVLTRASSCYDQDLAPRSELARAERVREGWRTKSAGGSGRRQGGKTDAHGMQERWSGGEVDCGAI
jgi:hypothetical protein